MVPSLNELSISYSNLPYYLPSLRAPEPTPSRYHGNRPADSRRAHRAAYADNRHPNAKARRRAQKAGRRAARAK